MTIDEAIKHCEDVADTPCFTDEEARCYKEHRQLAEWLKELKGFRDNGAKPWFTATWEYVQYGSPKIGNFHCSNCRHIAINHKLSEYCPHCGARMEVEE